MKRTLSVILALVVFAACDSTEPRVPTAIQVDHQTINMETGDTVRIEAVILDQRGRAYDVPPEGHTISWSSSAPGVATVQGGLVRGVGAGTATISASAGALTPAQVAVSVTARTVTMQLSFSYAGHRTGSLSVSVVSRVDQIDGDGSFAFSFYDFDFGSHDIFAQRRRTDGTYDIFWVWFEGDRITATGARTMSDGFIILGLDPQTDSWDAAYLLANGSTDFTTVTTRQMAGTFTATMAELDSGATLTVSSGTFNVPFLTEQELGGAHAIAGDAPLVAVPEPLLQRLAPRR